VTAAFGGVRLQALGAVAENKSEKPAAERLASTAGRQFEGEYQMGDV
jgi:hypothetical protein